MTKTGVGEAVGEEVERQEMAMDKQDMGEDGVGGSDWHGWESEGWGGQYFSSARMPSPPLIPGVEEELLVCDPQPFLGEGPGSDSGDGGGYEEEEMLSLMYDPILMCYYERTSGRYFQLKEGVGGQLYPTLHPEDLSRAAGESDS